MHLMFKILIQRRHCTNILSIRSMISSLYQSNQTFPSIIKFRNLINGDLQMNLLHKLLVMQVNVLGPSIVALKFISIKLSTEFMTHQTSLVVTTKQALFKYDSDSIFKARQKQKSYKISKDSKSQNLCVCSCFDKSLSLCASFFLQHHVLLFPCVFKLT